MSSPRKTDGATTKPSVIRDAGLPVSKANDSADAPAPTTHSHERNAFTWAKDSLDCQRYPGERALPFSYPPSLIITAQEFERIRVQYCRHDDRTPRMAFHFLQDGPKINSNDSNEMIQFKADLILAAADIAASDPHFAVSVRQYSDPALAALRTLKSR